MNKSYRSLSDFTRRASPEEKTDCYEAALEKATRAQLRTLEIAQLLNTTDAKLYQYLKRRDKRVPHAQNTVDSIYFDLRLPGGRPGVMKALNRLMKVRLIAKAHFRQGAIHYFAVSETPTSNQGRA